MSEVRSILNNTKINEFNGVAEPRMILQVTVEPCLTATVLLQPLFWLPGKNRHTFSCKKKPSLIQPPC